MGSTRTTASYSYDAPVGALVRMLLQAFLLRERPAVDKCKDNTQRHFVNKSIPAAAWTHRDETLRQLT